jgi:hypothetical protein
MRNPRCLTLRRQELEKIRKKVALNRYMERNPNVLLILCRRKIKLRHFKWIRNVLRHAKNKIKKSI